MHKPNLNLKVFLFFSFLLSTLTCVGQKEYSSLSIDEFAERIIGDSVQCVDVRTEREYAEGHISNAILIDVLKEDFSLKADSILSKELPVALYCRRGNRSKKAASALAQEGYTVYELDCGIKMWEEAGRELVK